MAPDLVAELIKSFQEETKALNHDRELATVQDKASLAKAERSIKSILDAIEDGRYQRSMLDRLYELERQEDQTEARLAKAPLPLPRIHPNIAEIYCTKIQHLEDTLARPDDAPEAAEAMRALIEKIVLTSGAKRGEVKAELYGELVAILAVTSGQKARSVLDDGDMRFSVMRGSQHPLCTFCRRGIEPKWPGTAPLLTEWPRG